MRLINLTISQNCIDKFHKKYVTILLRVTHIVRINYNLVVCLVNIISTVMDKTASLTIILLIV